VYAVVLPGASIFSILPNYTFSKEKPPDTMCIISEGCSQFNNRLSRRAWETAEKWL
jgi:hypothetical protein